MSDFSAFSTENILGDRAKKYEGATYNTDTKNVINF